MKIFLARIYCLLLFNYYSIRDHGNENIYGANLFLVFFNYYNIRDHAVIFVQVF